MDNFKLNSIEEALDDFRDGKFVIVVDDEGNLVGVIDAFSCF